MIRYLCKSCNDLICEASVCPNCNKRAELFDSKVFWCKNCETPLYNRKCNICGSECDCIGTDLRPVFPEERLLLEVLLGEPYKYINSSVWNVGSNHYIINGIKKNIPYVD